MTDTLRDRIAAAIYNASDEYSRKLMVCPDCPGASELEGDGKPVCYVLADAVIRELDNSLVVDGRVTFTVVDDAVIGEVGLKHSCRYRGGWGPFDD